MSKRSTKIRERTLRASCVSSRPYRRACVRSRLLSVRPVHSAPLSTAQHPMSTRPKQLPIAKPPQTHRRLPVVKIFINELSWHDRHHIRAQILHALRLMIGAALTRLIITLIVRISPLVRLDALIVVILLKLRLFLHLLLAVDVF